MHPCVSSIGLWAISTGGTSTPGAVFHVPPQTRFPELGASPRRGAVHPSYELEESIYYALLLYSSKRSGPKCPCRPATPSPKDGVLLLHHILDNGSTAPV